MIIFFTISFILYRKNTYFCNWKLIISFSEKLRNSYCS
jgi:hypothetical protein